MNVGIGCQKMEEKNWVNEFYKLNPDAIEDDIVEKKKEYKLDLFKGVLPQLDRRNKKFYEQSTDETKKEIAKSIWLLTRAMSLQAIIQNII